VLLPDELGISLIARYLRNWGYLDANSLMRQLLGTAQRVVHGACPPGIATLARSLRYPGLDPGMQFLRQHTLAPYLLSATPHAQARVLATRVADNDQVLHRALRVKAFEPSSASHLRFCCECVSSDIHRFAEPYWHRTHQITGISHCPKHRLPLLQSNVPFVATRSSQPVAASTVLAAGLVFPAVEPLFDRILEDALCKRVVEVMARRKFGTTLPRHSIRRSLLNLGYNGLGYKIAASRVVEDLNNFLRSHDCELTSLGPPADWHLRLFTKMPAASTPLQYHVFCLFLAYRWERELRAGVARSWPQLTAVHGPHRPAM
jgi:hypothetical protein